MNVSNVKVISIEFHEMTVLFALIHVKMCVHSYHITLILSTLLFSLISLVLSVLAVCVCVFVSARLYEYL